MLLTYKRNNRIALNAVKTLVTHWGNFEQRIHEISLIRYIRSFPSIQQQLILYLQTDGQSCHNVWHKKMYTYFGIEKNKNRAKIGDFKIHAKIV